MDRFNEQKIFKIGVKPKKGVNSIDLFWCFLSRNYKKEGQLVIHVIPRFEDKQKTIEVESEKDLKPDEVIIEPKIVIE